MARRIKVTQIKGFYEDLIVDAVAGTTLEWTKRVKKQLQLILGDSEVHGKQTSKGLKEVSQIMLYMQNLSALV